MTIEFKSHRDRTVVYSHPEGISLNGRHYLLDAPDGEVIIFDSPEDAAEFLVAAGFDRRALGSTDSGVYFDRESDNDELSYFNSEIKL